MSELIIRFLLGGLIVSLFAVVGDLFKPRSFAGIFGAAPSVAIATLALTFYKQGSGQATTEARSMLIGAVALGIYAWVVCQWIVRSKRSSLAIASAVMPLWFAVAFAAWAVFLR